MRDDLNKYYDILDCSYDASIHEIKQAYLDHVKLYHPDRLGNDERVKQIAQEKLRNIIEAYKILESHYLSQVGSSPSNKTTSHDTVDENSDVLVDQFRKYLRGTYYR